MKIKPRWTSGMFTCGSKLTLRLGPRSFSRNPSDTSALSPSSPFVLPVCSPAPVWPHLRHLRRAAEPSDVSSLLCFAVTLRASVRLQLHIFFLCLYRVEILLSTGLSSFFFLSFDFLYVCLSHESPVSHVIVSYSCLFLCPPKTLSRGLLRHFCATSLSWITCRCRAGSYLSAEEEV